MPARALTVNLVDFTDTAVEGVAVTLELKADEHTSASTIVASKVTKLSPASGIVSFPAVIPNADGVKNSRYIIRALDGDQEILYEEFWMPDAASDLNDIVDVVPTDATRVPYVDANETITGAWTFSGATNFTGAVTLDSIIESTAGVGVTIEGVLLKDSGITLGTGTAVNEISIDGTFAAATNDQLATALAIQTYVDAQVATVDTWAEVLALGNTSQGTVTTAIAVDVTEDALTTGNAIRVISNSADTGTRDLALIHNDNPLATNATVLRVVNDASGSVATFTGAGGVTVGTMLVKSGSITDSSGAISFGNENITTTGTLGSGTLTITTSADVKAIDIVSSAATNHTLNISGAANTTGSVLNVSGDTSLTTGSVAKFSSNSADTSTRSVVIVVNDSGSASGATALTVQQDASKRALFIDTNGNGESIVFDSECTSNWIVNFKTTVLTAGRAISMASFNNLTLGELIYVASNSADTSVRSIADLINDNPLAVGATVLRIQNDSTGLALDIHGDHDNPRGGYMALTGDGGLASGESFGTIDFVTEDASGSVAGTWARIEVVGIGGFDGTSSRSVFKFHTNGAVGSGLSYETLVLDNSGSTYAGGTFTISGNGNSSDTLKIDNNSLTAGSLIAMANLDGLTSGEGINLVSNSADTSTRSLTNIHNNNALATSATCLVLTQDASATGMRINQLGAGYAMNIHSTGAQTLMYLNMDGNDKTIEIDSEGTTADVIDVIGPTQTTGDIFTTNANGLTTGAILRAYSFGADTTARNLIFAHNDNTLATGSVPLRCTNDSTNDVAQFVGDTGTANIKRDGDLENTNNSYGAISDRDLKKDIVPARSQWEDIKAIGKIFKNYRLKANDNVVQLGVIAQDLQPISPGLVYKTDEKHLAVKYSIMYAKTTMAVGEIIERTETLEEKVERLEQQLEKLAA